MQHLFQMQRLTFASLSELCKIANTNKTLHAEASVLLARFSKGLEAGFLHLRALKD
jgi:hypothetical protein